MKRILIIKLGALGDFVQASFAMRAIRAAHPDAEITLLTTPPFAELAGALQLFDRVWTDGRPKGFAAHIALLRKLRKSRFERVYDLQTSSRSSWYFQALRPRPPEWSGVAMGASHPHDNPARAAMHTVDRQAEQLVKLGIAVPRGPDGRLAPDLSAIAKAHVPSLARFALPERFAVLVPGGSAHRPEKRWPAESYGALAAQLAGQGLVPVLLGGPAEREALEIVRRVCPEAISLEGRTSFLDILALGAKAALAAGNDTGPMHLLAAAGCPSLVLFSHASDPARCAPRGRRVAVIRAKALGELQVPEVLDSLTALNATTTLPS